MSRHRHLLVRHVHPNWLGHSDPTLAGYKRADRPHWHCWWQHDHPEEEPAVEPVPIKYPYVGGLRWAFMRWADIESASHPGTVYLRRLRIVQTPWVALYLHFIFEADDDRDPHDHPFAFWSWVVRGGYKEQIYRRSAVITNNGVTKHHYHHRTSSWRAGSLHRMPRGQAHQITELRSGTTTLVLCGRNHGSWGFWTDKGWVPWKEYRDTRAA